MIGIPLMIVGCTKTTPAVVGSGTQDAEMSLFAMNKGNAVSNAMTRGFVMGSGTDAFKDIADPSAAHPTGEPRTISLSAWNSTKEADYFLGKKFAKGTDDLWHATPKIYYPLGCEVDLLGFSAGDTVVADWQSAHAVKLQVVNTQDDILYSSTTASSTEPVPTMTFHHSQAWIQFLLTANIPDAVRVDSIYWENIYGKGELRLEFDEESTELPKADWNFFTQDLCNVAIDDTTHKLDTTMLSSTAIELNMLLPEQAHTSFVILYTLENGTETGKQFAYRVEASSLTSTEWERSHKYTYTVNFEMSRITLAPTVKLWVEEHIDRMNSIDLIEGVFSVSSSDKVLFSKGNLQYRPCDSTWRFAENQYDYVGGDVPAEYGTVPPGGFLPTTIHIGSVGTSSNNPHAIGSAITMSDAERKNYDGWIDLFGFGASGFNPGIPGRHYQPWETATADTLDYGPVMIDHTTDWGRHIRVYEYMPGLSFRTLSEDEWTYLMKTDRCTNPHFKHSWMLGKLKYANDLRGTVEGMFLFPDNFEWKEHFGPEPTRYELASMDYGYLVDNTSGGRWDEMDYAGVVFIPCAGMRTLTVVPMVGDLVTYVPGNLFSPLLPTHGLFLWTTTCGKCMVGGAIAPMKPAYGCSVRLVTDWPV